MSGFIAQDRCAVTAELVTFDSPFRYDTGPFKGQKIRVTCHKAVEQRLKLALKRAKNFSKFGKLDKVERIDSFACRAIRGSTTLSNHAKGAAWDIFATNPQTPPPGGVWEPTTTYGSDFASCFTDLGFTWGRQWSRRDDPHLEWSGNHVLPLTAEERLRTRKLAKERYGAGRP